VFNRKIDGQKAIFIIHNDKLTFEMFRENYDQLKFDLKSQNDVHYKGYLYMSNKREKDYPCSVIFPASEADIKLYTSKWVERYESGKDYLNITKPYIEKHGPSVQVISTLK
jgi:hypothetical protein